MHAFLSQVLAPMTIYSCNNTRIKEPKCFFFFTLTIWDFMEFAASVMITTVLCRILHIADDNESNTQ